MQTEAIDLGEQTITIEQEVNDAIMAAEITPTLLIEQLDLHNELRGYAAGEDICDSVPEGHNLKLWKLHNNCD